MSLHHPYGHCRGDMASPNDRGRPFTPLWNESSTYEPVSHEEEQYESKIKEVPDSEDERLYLGSLLRDSRVRSVRDAGCTKVVVWLLLASFWTLLFFLLVLNFGQKKQDDKIWTNCGSDPATARSRGCRFDVTNFSWQTRECFDETIVAEFAELEPWPFWTSKYGNESVSHEVAYQGDQPLWTSWRHHLMHCTYIFRRMQRAYESGWIDSSLRKYEHTVHCATILMQEGEGEEGGRIFVTGNDRHFTYLNLIFPECERFERGTTDSAWWEGRPPRHIAY